MVVVGQILPTEVVHSELVEFLPTDCYKCRRFVQTLNLSKKLGEVPGGVMCWSSSGEEHRQEDSLKLGRFLVGVVSTCSLPGLDTLLCPLLKAAKFS